MITCFKSKTKLFSTTYLLSNTTKDLKVMLTRIDNEQPPTFIRKCKVNLPTLKFNILRGQKKLTNSPSFFHYLVQVVQIQSISLFHQLPYNRTIDFMLFCSVFSHKLFRQKKENQQFYNFLTFAIERFDVFKFKVSFMEFYLYRKKRG